MKTFIKLGLGILVWIVCRDMIILIDSSLDFSIEFLSYIALPVSILITYICCNRLEQGLDKIRENVFFIITTISIWNLLSKLLILVPHNDKSNLGIVIALVILVIAGIPVAVVVTNKIFTFIKSTK